MFGRGSFFLRILGVLILIGLLLVGGALLFRAGQAQGYQMGAAASAAASGETPGTAPVVPYGPGYWPGYWPGYYPARTSAFSRSAGCAARSSWFFLALFAFRLIFRRGAGFTTAGAQAAGGASTRVGPHGWGPPAETGQGGTKTTLTSRPVVHPHRQNRLKDQRDRPVLKHRAWCERSSPCEASGLGV